MRVWPYIYAHNRAWQIKTASAMTWLHCICQIKAQRVKSHIFLRISFVTLSFSFLTLWHPSFSFPPPSSPFSPISPPFAVFPRLTSPAPPLPLLDSPHRVEDLLADPDPTHKRRVDNQLPLSSGLNRSSSEFPRDAMPSEKRTVTHYPSSTQPLIPNLWLSYPRSFRFLRFRIQQDEHDSFWDEVTVQSSHRWPNRHLNHVALYFQSTLKSQSVASLVAAFL